MCPRSTCKQHILKVIKSSKGKELCDGIDDTLNWNQNLEVKIIAEPASVADFPLHQIFTCLIKTDDKPIDRQKRSLVHEAQASVGMGGGYM